MSHVIGEIGSALGMAFLMGWEILWPLVLGFALSGIVQAVVTKGEMSRLLPDSSARTILIASGLFLVFLRRYRFGSILVP